MKKLLALVLCCCMVLGLSAVALGEGSKVINVWSFTDEVPKMLDRYVELHPEFGYEIKSTIIAMTDGAYMPALDQALLGGGADAPDLYCAEQAFILKYTQGDAAQFALPYSELGIDVEAKIAASEIAPYSVDIGTNPNGDVVALGFQATGGAFIYRRSLAIDTFGTDDPAVIQNIIGPGWDKYFEAAEALKAKGYAIVSGDGDIWHAVENGAEKGWIVDGKLYIDPARELFLDYSRALTENGYSNLTTDWQEAWFADFADNGEKPVFGYFGPAWLINYVMAGNLGGSEPGEGTFGDWAVCVPPVGFFWGGTWLLASASTQNHEGLAEIIEWITLDSSDTGLQYYWANGTLFGEGGTKDSVASGVVMAKSNGTLSLLGGQDMFEAFVPANAFANGKLMTQHDDTINRYFREVVRLYAAGELSREEAIENFRQTVADNLDIIVE